MAKNSVNQKRERNMEDEASAKRSKAEMDTKNSAKNKGCGCSKGSKRHAD